MTDRDASPLLAAESLGFYPATLPYDRKLLWCWNVPEMKSSFNSRIAKMHNAAKTLSHRFDHFTAGDFDRILAEIRTEWNSVYGKPDHVDRVREYRRLAQGGATVPPLCPLDEDSDGDDVSFGDEAEMAALRLIRSAPCGPLANELRICAQRFRDALAAREQNAFDLGSVLGAEWNKRRSRFPSPMVDFLGDSPLLLPTAASQPTEFAPTGLDLAAAAREVDGLSDRVTRNGQILAIREKLRKQLRKVSQPFLRIDSQTRCAEFLGVELTLSVAEYGFLRTVWDAGCKVVRKSAFTGSEAYIQKAKSDLMKNLRAVAGQGTRPAPTGVDINQWISGLFISERGVGYRLGVNPDQISFH